MPGNSARPREDLLVLVVDDEPAVREVLKIRFQAWGVRSAANAEEAERIAAHVEPDTVVTDVVLHGRSRLDLTKALRARRDPRSR